MRHVLCRLTYYGCNFDIGGARKVNTTYSANYETAKAGETLSLSHTLSFDALQPANMLTNLADFAL